ncbi:unnamed protein product [Meloidogyne enterolobii]|uniref:Uncharacterized protein n=1 Tax=Meloidogyne enterolobii TaxID=390850 RepID=A0ACB0YER7_MELEN
MTKLIVVHGIIFGFWGQLSLPPSTIQFQCPPRPNHGTEGRPILLRANHFKVTNSGGYVHFYAVEIQLVFFFNCSGLEVGDFCEKGSKDD